MTVELTFRITDLEKKAIAFCREKDVPYPIGKYLVKFAEEVTKELEKENAELKEKLEIEQNAKGDWFGKAVTKDRRLNEAKEIIYDFYDSCKGNGTTCVNTGTRFIDFIELVNKAEAFLKEQNYESFGNER